MSLLATLSFADGHTVELVVVNEAEAEFHRLFMSATAVSTRPCDAKAGRVTLGAEPGQRDEEAEDPRVLYVRRTWGILTYDQLGRGEAVGVGRRQEDKSAGLKDTWGGGFHLDVLGAQAELFASECCLGIPWVPAKMNEPDVPPDFDVKATRFLASRNGLEYGLRVNVKNREDRRYLAVFANPPQFTLRGWMPGRLVKDPRFPASAHRPDWDGWVIPWSRLWPVEERKA